MQCVRGFMRRALAVALWAVAGLSLHAQQTPAVPGVAIVNLDGKAVRVQVLGLQNRRPGTPLVVFEAGTANPLEIWGGILPQVAAIAPVVAYDRAGLGRSEWDNTTPTPQHVAGRLRRLLQQIGAAPPYVLVGYSWGGMLTRYFAGYYPRDVTGLVFVDPLPMVTQPVADNVGPFDVIGAGRAGYDAYWSSLAALLGEATFVGNADLFTDPGVFYSFALMPDGKIRAYLGGGPGGLVSVLRERQAVGRLRAPDGTAGPYEMLSPRQTSRLAASSTECSAGSSLAHLTVQDADTVASAVEQFRRRPAAGFSDCLMLEVARKAGHAPLGTFDRDPGKLDSAHLL